MNVDSQSPARLAYDVLGTNGRPLDPIFAPRNVAVIGATEKPGSVGRTILWNLISSPFGGTVFPVNPNHPSVLGIKAYPTISSRPGSDRPGRHRHARTQCAGPDRCVCRGRRSRGHHHLGRLQGNRSGGDGAGTADSGAGAARQDADRRAELPGCDESADRPERHLRRRHGSARQRRLPQPERSALHRHARLEFAGQRRLQRLRLRRLDAGCRLGRPDRLPRRRSSHQEHHHLHGVDRRLRGRSCRRRARWR